MYRNNTEPQFVLGAILLLSCLTFALVLLLTVGSLLK